MNQININRQKYLYLFADCFLVKGFTRTMICDLTRRKMYFIDNVYFDLLTELKSSSIGQVADMLEAEEDMIEFDKFLKYLLDEELATYVDNINDFPAINLQWDHPSPITNAIIDIRDQVPDIDNIFGQLENLNCQFIQIRSFTALPINDIYAIMTSSLKTNFKNVQIVTKFDEQDYSFIILDAIVQKFPAANLVIHSTSEEYYEKLGPKKITSRLMFLKQEISSCDSCGVINIQSFNIPYVAGFVENIMHNSCLNRKISIDEKGEIKNCPSMKASYGNIESVTLESVLLNKVFKTVWDINKDMIEVCRDCEYRYICSDCRAFTQESENPILSKPSKCSYDPYTGVWNN
jgi:SPASM domain peptide maturase of grasp-with-spasm system